MLLGPTENVNDIMREMQKDISADIYGDISGHEYWAEEIASLRAAVRKLREQLSTPQ